MKTLDTIKKISKILFYLSISFAVIYTAIDLSNYNWTKITTEGSALAAECNLKIAEYKKDNRVTNEDELVQTIIGLCNGISYKSYLDYNELPL